MRDERLSRSPLLALVDNGLVTAVTFEGDENDASSTVEVNGDGCSDRTLNDDDDDDDCAVLAGGSRSALGTEFDPS